MNDDEKSITIKDPSGNTWCMDGQGNIEVTAPKNITLNAGENITMSAGMNIISTAGENVSTSAGMNISESAGGMMMQNAVLDYSLVAANIMEIAQGERKSKAKEIKENAQNKEVSVQENNDWHSQKEFNNNSGEKSKSS